MHERLDHEDVMKRDISELGLALKRLDSIIVVARAKRSVRARDGKETAGPSPPSARSATGFGMTA
jgi:hypothetical protein